MAKTKDKVCRVDAGCSLQMGSCMSAAAADQPLLDRRTQWHVLSATIKQPACRYVRLRAAPSSMLGVSADDNIGVTADGEVVVGRRRSHRADVFRPRPQCPGRPPCPWLGPPWSLVP